MKKFWHALDGQRVEHASAIFRKWTLIAACVGGSAFLLYRSSTSEAAVNSVTVALVCGVTSLLLLLSAIGVALQEETQAPQRW